MTPKRLDGLRNRTQDPVIAILQACYEVMPDASASDKAQWCMAAQRQFKRDGKLPKAHQIGQPVPYHDDPVMARLCADTGRSQGER